ncbi:hypothetical protein QTP88_006540 [Uroleucon formosanum]
MPKVEIARRMTCHFIDEETYFRQSYVIGCICIKGSHNYQHITEVITEIAKTYKIDLSKITHVVTDNAPNFGKAFRTFSSLSTHEASTSDLGNFDENSSASSNFDSGSDCSDLDSERVNLNNLLNMESILANDISKISNNDYNKMSNQLLGNYQTFGIWPVEVQQYQTQYTTFASVGSQFLCEWAFVKEYYNVMKPLAFSLDKLQGEKNSFLGYVTPTLLVLRKLLIQSNQLTYCKPLSLFYKASISHPKFKMDWVPVRYRDLCKKMFIDECNLMSSLITTNSDSADDSDNMSDKEFYSNICDQNSNHDSPNEEINVQVLKYLNSKKKKEL